MTAVVPELSVIVAVVSGGSHLRRCLQSLLHQDRAPVMEIIVPHTGKEPGINGLASEFPEVSFPVIESLRAAFRTDGWSREHLDELRTIGVNLARGERIALVEDHGRADSNWARAMIDAHRAPHAAIGGAIENEVNRTLNWAVYFSDFGRYQNPVKEGPSAWLSDVNISYKKDALEEIREVWHHSFHETSVNQSLLKKGKMLWLSSTIVMYQHREGLTLGSAIKERFVWGRSFASIRAREISVALRWFYLFLSPALPAILIVRRIRDIVQKKRLLLKFLVALPTTSLLALFWSAGEFAGYFAGSPSGEKRE